MMTITKTVPELERALAQCLAGIKPMLLYLHFQLIRF